VAAPTLNLSRSAQRQGQRVLHAVRSATRRVCTPRPQRATASLQKRQESTPERLVAQTGRALERRWRRRSTPPGILPPICVPNVVASISYAPDSTSTPPLWTPFRSATRPDRTRRTGGSRRLRGPCRWRDHFPPKLSPCREKIDPLLRTTSDNAGPLRGIERYRQAPPGGGGDQGATRHRVWR
jgi:hypothetical protein